MLPSSILSSYTTAAATTLASVMNSGHAHGISTGISGGIGALNSHGGHPLGGGITTGIHALGLTASTNNHTLPSNIDALTAGLAGNAINVCGNGGIGGIGGIGITANLPMGTAAVSGLHTSVSPYAFHYTQHIDGLEKWKSSGKWKIVIGASVKDVGEIQFTESQMGKQIARRETG